MDREDSPSARKILSDNLKALKGAHEELSTIEKIVEKSDGRLTNGTVGRIHAGSHTTDIDTLQELAKVFRLQPWQLLVENLNPKALPQIADEVFAERLRNIIQMADAKKRNRRAQSSAHPLESNERQKQMNPALKKVLDEGAGRGTGRKAGRVQKPGTRRRA